MTESETAELESATSLVLPEAYRRLLLDYPAFPESVVDPDVRPQDDELYASRDLLWGANVDGAAYLREVFPASYFAIGESGCGDFYAIDTQHPDSPVYISGPHQGEYPQDENGNRLPSYASITQFIDSLREEIHGWKGSAATPCLGQTAGVTRRPAPLLPCERAREAGTRCRCRS